jgi:hypothetical protein
MALRIALVTPAPLDAPRGNAVTVARIADGLGARGLDVRVWEAGVEGAEHRMQEPPNVIHAFHAYHSGPEACALAKACGAPLVVTLTGTDVSEHLAHPSTATTVRDVLRRAAAVTGFHASVLATVRDAAPEIDGRLAVVPQSVRFPEPDPAAAPIPAITGAPCVLFPAGIRPVKRPTFPLVPLDAIARRHAGLHLWYVGPSIDPDEMRRLEEALAPRPWAHYLGAVPHQAMPDLLGASDIVLNCSVSEGGMPNAVAEALALGRAVLAADIPGNRSLIEDGVTGYLFASPAELAEKADRLIRDAELRRDLGDAGRRLVTTRFTPAAEIEGYLAVYQRAVNGHAPR